MTSRKIRESSIKDTQKNGSQGLLHSNHLLFIEFSFSVRLLVRMKNTKGKEILGPESSKSTGLLDLRLKTELWFRSRSDDERRDGDTEGDSYTVKGTFLFLIQYMS